MTGEGGDGSGRFTVIVENDVTSWKDHAGVSYHYPRAYRAFLEPGTRLIHYKGSLTDRSFRSARLSDKPHYFATSIAGLSTIDPDSPKGDLFVEIVDYTVFDEAVSFRRDDGEYREDIPASKERNYWRFGVRSVSESVALEILAAASLNDTVPPTEGGELTSVMIEGGKRRVWSTVYERRRELRTAALKLHGTACFACDVELGKLYGEVAKGFIHVHHKRPLAITGEATVDAKADLVPLCPTCHAIVHLRGKLRTVNDVRAMLGKAPIPLGD